jgi:phosphatidylinositol glycan class V
LLRWDTFYFLHVAKHGYVYEHEWAFFPGPIYLTGYLFDGGTLSHILLAALATVLACDTSQTLYSLSLHHLQSPALALSASLLSLLPTSPATLYFAPYSEPLFTYFSYQGTLPYVLSSLILNAKSGMLCCARHQWFKASLFFAFASAFRSNGILLSGFIFWGLIAQPAMAKRMVRKYSSLFYSSHSLYLQPTMRAIIKSIALAAIVIAPFVVYHLAAYVVFCSETSSRPGWCSQFPPSIYTHVQSTYWNVGFLRYWTLSQLPNFLLAAPTLLVILAFSFHHLKGTWHSSSNRKDKSQLDCAFQNATIAPHAIHAIIFSLILIFASHTQIILRLASAMPLVYWAAAWLLYEHPALGRLWVTWSVLWGITSIICWATFLPPA